MFGKGSDSEKVWKWIQQENKHIQDIFAVHPNLDGVRLLDGHISEREVSLSYLLEYVLKDYLPEKKRYINR